jgi:hypothetical protein
MSSRSIKFVFKEDGTVESDAKGFKGTDCVKQTEKFLVALKPQLQKRKLKQEYQYVGQQQQATVHEEEGA